MRRNIGGLTCPCKVAAQHVAARFFALFWLYFEFCEDFLTYGNCSGVTGHYKVLAQLIYQRS